MSMWIYYLYTSLLAPTLQVAPAIEVAIISDDIVVKFSFPEVSYHIS